LRVLPKRRNLQGRFLAIDGLVTGLTVLGDRARCGQLYPLTEDYILTGAVSAIMGVGPSSPQLAAALAADAAGLTPRAREHFETALRQARDVPVRALQPMVLYWYGRATSRASEPAEVARGHAMVEAAMTDFRALGMVVHVGLAARWLREEPMSVRSAAAGASEARKKATPEPALTDFGIRRRHGLARRKGGLDVAGVAALPAILEPRAAARHVRVDRDDLVVDTFV
jgi:hypothetical protein